VATVARVVALVLVVLASGGCIEWADTGRGGYQKGYDYCLGKPIKDLAQEFDVPRKPQPVADAVADKFGGRDDERAETRRGCLAGLRDAAGF
jgi:hypothetical protein